MEEVKRGPGRPRIHGVGDLTLGDQPYVTTVDEPGDLIKGQLSQISVESGAEDRNTTSLYTPNEFTRASVRMWVAAGIVTTAMAARLRISLPTLLKHFSVEVEMGRQFERMEVLQSLRSKVKAGDLGAIKHYMSVLDAADAEYAVKDLVSTRHEEEAQSAERAASKAPKLGKKEQAKLDAMQEDLTTPLGAALARASMRAFN